MALRRNIRASRTLRDPGKKRTSDHLDLERLAKLLGVTTPQEFDEHVMEQESGVYGEVLRQGGTDAQAEKEERRQQEENYRQYRNALIATGDHFFEQHGLTLIELKRKPWGVRVVPTTSWENAASKLVNTINGVGMFEFRSVSEFAKSGPWTMREAVLNHLGWIKDRADVYGDTRPQSYFQRQMRY